MDRYEETAVRLAVPGSGEWPERPERPERLARLEADVAHLARMMMLIPKGHATVADYGRLREIAERVEGAEDE